MNTYIRSAFISRPFNHVFNLLLLIVRRKSGNQSQKLTSWQQSRKEAANHSRLLTSVEKVIIMQEDPSRDAQTAKGEGDPATTRKAPFGTRYLTDPKNVFQHNAWDNVVWDEEQEMEARRTTQEQLEHAMSAEQQEELEREADMHWDKFYNQHQNRFFKDRHWLFIEFPELYSRCGLHKSAASATTDLTQTDTEMATSAAGSCVKNKDTALVDTEKNIPSLTRDTMSCGVETVNSQDEKEHCRASGPSSCKETHIDSETGKSTEPQGIHSVVEILKETSVTSEEDDCAKLSSTGDFPGASATFRLLEVGCGVGNTVFPVLSTNNDPGLMMYCCDFSSTAVQLVKEHPDYDPRRCHAFVWDITDETVTLPFPSESLDIIILIFVLSAVHPDKMQQAVNRLASCLKPGGQLLFRDYGRYDLAQLRFKKGRCLSENFYVRGDGTRCYFFTQEELRSMFTVAGLDEVQNLVDRRLQVNRGRQIKMYRVWVQCKYRKPPTKTETLSVEHKSS